MTPSMDSLTPPPSFWPWLLNSELMTTRLTKFMKLREIEELVDFGPLLGLFMRLLRCL